MKLSFKSKTLLAVGLILVFAGVVLAATLLTWTRTITWNVPGTEGFDVYATTGSGSSWTQEAEIPTSGSVDISGAGPYPWIEDYWIVNTGNVPVQIQMNAQGGQQNGLVVVWTLEYDSLFGQPGDQNPPPGNTWSQGWGVNLQVGEYVVFQLAITPPVGAGSYSYTFYGS